MEELLTTLRTIPGIDPSIGCSEDEPKWWVKFSTDIDHEIAWNIVQEFGNLFNYLSTNERLPTMFYPVSPPSYMNGGPKDCLSWVIECGDEKFTPAQALQWIKARLPEPLDSVEAWKATES